MQAKRDLQPDFDHLMSLFDKMKEQFQSEINVRRSNNSGSRNGIKEDSVGSNRDLHSRRQQPNQANINHGASLDTPNEFS